MSKLSGFLLQGFVLNSIISLTYEQGFDSFSIITARDSIDASRDDIRSLMPGFYQYAYDSLPVDPTYIQDGGNDMYDVGNRVNIVESGSTAYDAVYGEQHNFPNSDFLTSAGHPFFALLRINNPDENPLTYTLRVHGNAGADGIGRITSHGGTYTVAGVTITYRAFQVRGAGDPSICEVYFTLASTDVWGSNSPTPQFSFGTSTDSLSNTMTIAGTPSRMFAGYMLLSKLGGVGVTNSEIDAVMSQVPQSVNECTAEIASCSGNATCVNTEGNLTCSCNIGFTRNDITCLDGNECIDNNCNENVACANVGNFTCSCYPDFSGNGVVCSDIDECASVSNPHNCDENADCTNTNGSFTCACNTGFTGNGTECTDIDECASDTTNDCHEFGECRNRIGSFTCSCIAGYAGDGRSCTEAFSIVCNPTSMEVRALSRYFTDKNIDLEELHFRDYSCGGEVDSSSPDTWVFNIATLSSCSIEQTSNSTHLIYTNTLNNYASGSIINIGYKELLTFSCAYAKDLDDLTLTTHYGVIRNIANLTAPTREGVFEAELNHYTDDSHNTPETRDEFEPLEILYIMIELRTSDPNLTLVIDRCWITPTPNITHHQQYTIIEDGCPATDPSGNVQITQSGVGHRAHFESAMFAYVDYNTTFLHCSLEICSSASGESCVPVCLQRSKRSLSSNALSRIRRQATQQEETLSIGPFKIIRDNGDQNQPLAQTGLSLTVLVAILVAVVVVVIACLAFAAFWYRGTRISRLNKLDPVVFTNPALTSD